MWRIGKGQTVDTIKKNLSPTPLRSDPVMSRCIPMTGLVVEGTTTSSTVSKLPTKQIEGGNGTNNISTSLMMQVRNQIIIIVSFNFQILHLFETILQIIIPLLSPSVRYV